MTFPGGKQSDLQGGPPTVSEIIPTIKMMETRDWIRKGSVISISFTLVAVFLMYYAAEHDPPLYELYGLMVAGFMAMESVHVIYKLCGIRKPVWWLTLISGFTFAVCRLIATNCSIFDSYYKITNHIPDLLIGHADSFFDKWGRFFFSAAIPEELTKIFPVVVIFLFARFLASPWRERLGVREPLDGVLLGCASAMGFSASETVYSKFLYMNCQGFNHHLQLVSANAGLLIFPRGLGEVAGHAAYTGFIGYAIGLAIVRPRRRWFTLLSGFLIATLAHALWDATSDYSTNYFISLPVAIACYALLAAAILKARQISPHRASNFATNFMRGLPGDPGLPIASSWKISTGTSESDRDFPPAASTPVTASPVAQPKTAPLAFTFYVAGKVILLTQGYKIMAGDIPELTASAEDGVLAEVVSSPKHPGVFGLQNNSTTVWKIRMPGGVEEELPEGRAIRLTRGMVFLFGDARGEIL